MVGGACSSAREDVAEVLANLDGPSDRNNSHEDVLVELAADVEVPCSVLHTTSDHTQSVAAVAFFAPCRALNHCPYASQQWPLYISRVLVVLSRCVAFFQRH